MLAYPRRFANAGIPSECLKVRCASRTERSPFPDDLLNSDVCLAAVSESRIERALINLLVSRYFFNSQHGLRLIHATDSPKTCHTLLFLLCCANFQATALTVRITRSTLALLVEWLGSVYSTLVIPCFLSCRRKFGVRNPGALSHCKVAIGI